MTDWSNGIYKVKPGLKAYLFVGEAGNALDELVSRAVDGVDYVKTIYPPLTFTDMSVVLGMPEETQCLMIRDAEKLSPYDVALISKYLKPKKVKGRSLLMVGSKMPTEEYMLRQAMKQGLIIEVKDPGGDLGRKNLAQWLGEECKVMVVDAAEVCERVNYSIEQLVWVRKAYLAMSGGKVLDRTVSQKLLSLATPSAAVDDVFSLVMSKNKKAPLAAAGLNVSQTIQLLHMLEAALTDISLLWPHVADNYTLKSLSNKSELHIIRVIELEKYVSGYPPPVIARCRRALNIGLANSFQPEAAKTVALLWS